MTLEYRFRRNFRIEENGCWIWTAYRQKSGHGRLRINGKNYYAHRVARYLYCGFDLDSDIQVNHRSDKCNNPACINPNHTYEGTQSDNTRDKSLFTTHCPKGHEYNEKNIRYYKHCKVCKICGKIRYRKNKNI